MSDDVPTYSLWPSAHYFACGLILTIPLVFVIDDVWLAGIWGGFVGCMFTLAVLEFFGVGAEWRRRR